MNRSQLPRRQLLQYLVRRPSHPRGIWLVDFLLPMAVFGAGVVVAIGQTPLCNG